MALDTSMEKGTFTFIWKIENFSHCLQKEGERLESTEFTVDSLNESRWRIWMYPKGSDEYGADGYFNFYLFCVDWNSCDFYVDFQLSLVAADGSIINKGKALAIMFDSYSARMSDGHIYNQKDIYDTKRSIYLPQDTLTVFCRLWKTNGDISERVRCLARSRVGMKRMSKTWNIPDFSKLKLGYQSRRAVSFPDMDDDYRIILNVILESFFTDIFLRIHIKRDKYPSKLILSCTISVLNRYKIPLKVMQHKLMCLPNQELLWTSPKFVSRRELIESKNDLLPQDTLSLKFEFTLSYGVEYERIERIHYGPPTSLREDSIGIWWNTTGIPPDCPPSDSEAEGSLKSDLLSFYQQQTESDFELRSEGVTFPVHKTILSARSPVFKAMFTCGMQEVTTNYLNVPDIDADTLTRMLLYVYTDTIEELELESASKLFYASDKYLILSLKQKCSSALKSNLTVLNVGVLLVLADRHHDDELTSAVHEFILTHAEEIIRSTEWLEFEKSDYNLAAKTMYEVFRKKLQIKS